MRVSILLVLVFFSACRNDKLTTSDETLEEVRPYKLICLGSDFSIGVGLDPGDAYPALLQKRLDSLGIDTKVVNASIKGETISGAEQRIPWLLQQRVEGFILELGQRESEQQLAQEQVFEQWSLLLQKIRAAKPEIDLFMLGASADAPEWQTLNKEYDLIFLQPNFELDLSVASAKNQQQLADWIVENYQDEFKSKSKK